MRMHQIEVDDEVLGYLKAKAEAFVDTPNSVLRRQLLEGRPGRKTRPGSGGSGDGEPPDVPAGAPQALRQILEVVILVQREGKTRTEATALVARQHGVAPQTVLDKYCRQLGLTAAEFDKLIDEPELARLRELLREKEKFSRWAPAIDDLLSRLA